MENSQSTQPIPSSEPSIRVVLSQSAEKTVWASQIIQLIITAERSNYVFEPSLREKLINFNIHHPNYLFNPRIGRQILSIFGRSDLSDKYYKHDDKQGIQQQPSFVFWPNLLVTQQIFKYLLGPVQNSVLIGPKGISKTTSIWLFLHLSSFINKLAIEASIEYIKRIQLEQLLSQGLIIRVPKYWYENFKNLQQPDYSVKSRAYYNTRGISFFSRQATELSDYMKTTFSHISFDAFKLSLETKYSLCGIEQRVIIDDIDDIVAEFFCIYKYINSINVDQISDEMKFRYLENNQCRIYLDKACKMGKGYTICANTDIHDEFFMQSCHYKTNLFLQTLLSDSKPRRVQMIFRELLDESWAKVDFAFSIWYEVEKTLKSQIREDQLEKIRLDFLSTAKGLQLNGNYCYALVAKFCQHGLPYIQSPSGKDIGKLLKKFQLKQSQYQMIQIQKEQPSQKLLQVLSLFAWRNVCYPQLFAVSLSKMRQSLGGPILWDYFLNKKQQQQYFHTAYDTLNHSLQFNWTAKQFAEVTALIPFRSICQAYENILSFRQGWKTAYKTRVNPYLSSLLNILNVGTTITLKDGKQGHGRQIQLCISEQAYFQQQFMNIQSFKVFGQDIQMKFNSAIMMADRYPFKWVLGVPSAMKPKYNSSPSTDNQKWMDFLTCKYDEIHKKIFINTFFVITDSAQLNRKLELTQQLLGKITCAKKFKITHIFIVADYNEALFYSVENLNENFEIVFKAFDYIEARTERSRCQGFITDFYELQGVNKITKRLTD